MQTDILNKIASGAFETNEGRKEWQQLILDHYGRNRRCFMPLLDSYVRSDDTIGVISHSMGWTVSKNPCRGLPFDQIHDLCGRFVVEFTTGRFVYHQAFVIGHSLYDSFDLPGKGGRQPTCRPIEGELLQALQNYTDPDNTQIIIGMRSDYAFTGVAYYPLELPSV